MYSVLIIGAGASGLVSAIILARRGKRVAILEKNSKVGKKLLATGNGRCNITNRKITLDKFYSQNPKFIEKVLDGYSFYSIKEFFNSIGLILTEEKEGKIFPISLQALSVVELLEYECKRLGVDIFCNSRVESVKKFKNRYRVEFNNSSLESKNLIIATGNISAPQLGGVDDGLEFARSLGHTIITPYPSLVQLTSPMANLKKISGVKISSRVTLRLKDKIIEKRGDILFTNYGISGLAILDISRFVVEELKYKKEVILTVDLIPNLSKDRLRAILNRRDRPLEIILQGLINKKIISFILDSKIENIIRNIKFFKFRIDGTRGFKGAEIATGGVDTREINPKSLKSKKHKGLYFTGELLDVDGNRGGFNLHFVWVCGLRVGKSIWRVMKI